MPWKEGEKANVGTGLPREDEDRYPGQGTRRVERRGGERERGFLHPEKLSQCEKQTRRGTRTCKQKGASGMSKTSSS
eukprot:759516-Hanusia_phi.AAC.1